MTGRLAAVSGLVIQGNFRADWGVVKMQLARPASDTSGPRLKGGSSVLHNAVDLDVSRLELAPRGTGRPLPAMLRRVAEEHFQADLSGVRVHIGLQAQQLGAQAFTLASDVYFAPGRYPGSTPGRQILGHELAHVVQQREGRIRNPFGEGVAMINEPELEDEANLHGRQIARILSLPAQRFLQPRFPSFRARLPKWGQAVQPMWLVNKDPTWAQTRDYVITNPGDFGGGELRDFGVGNEEAFRCPGCNRWLPVSRGTVDHKKPKKTLRRLVEDKGPDGAPGELNWSRIYWSSNNRMRSVAVDETKATHLDMLPNWVENDLNNLELMCHSCNSSKNERHNAGGGGAPPANTQAREQKTVPGGPQHNVIMVAPGVEPAASNPDTASFSTAWAATRRFFVAEMYHAAGVATADFSNGNGNGNEPCYTCPDCNRRLPIALATVDHVLPKAGPNWWRSLDLTNLQLMCNICNSSKGNR